MWLPAIRRAAVDPGQSRTQVSPEIITPMSTAWPAEGSIAACCMTATRRGTAVLRPRRLLQPFRRARAALHLVPHRRPLRRGLSAASIACARSPGARLRVGRWRGGSPCRCTCTCRFATSVCYYCACNKVITRHHERAGEYLDALEARGRPARAALGPGIAVSAAALRRRHADLPVDAELARLMDALRRAFRSRRAPSFPSRSTRARRHARPGACCAALGFNRLELRRAGLRPRGAAGGAPRAAFRDRAGD